MNNDELLEKYKDILFFIEDAVVSYYHAHTGLSDHNVDKVYETISRTLQNELRDKKPPRIKLNELEAELHEGLVKRQFWIKWDSFARSVKLQGDKTK